MIAAMDQAVLPGLTRYHRCLLGQARNILNLLANYFCSSRSTSKKIVSIVSTLLLMRLGDPCLCD